MKMPLTLMNHETPHHGCQMTPPAGQRPTAQIYFHNVATGESTHVGPGTVINGEQFWKDATSGVVEVARGQKLYRQSYTKGKPDGPLKNLGPIKNRRGTTVTFHADEEIFGSHRFKPSRLFKPIRSKAYLFSGVEIRWKSAIDDGETPVEATFHFPGGLSDYLTETLGGSNPATNRSEERFSRNAETESLSRMPSSA